MDIHGKITQSNAIRILAYLLVRQGWFAVRREMKKTMLVFLGTGLAYIGGWGAMYYSKVFRWTWIEWPFFACLSVTALGVQIASVVIGFFCWRKFHQGFAQWCKSYYSLFHVHPVSIFVVFLNSYLTTLLTVYEIFFLPSFRR